MRKKGTTVNPLSPSFIVLPSEIELETIGGEPINSFVENCTREAIALAEFLSQGPTPMLVSFRAGNILIRVGPGTDILAIMRDYNRAKEGYIRPEVGPYPNVPLSQKERENDERIRIATEQLLSDE